MNDNQRTASGDIPSTRAELRATQTPNKWVPSPGVRLWLYGVLATLAPVGVAYGVVTAEQGGMWLAVASAVLGVSNLLAARNVPKG